MRMDAALLQYLQAGCPFLLAEEGAWEDPEQFGFKQCVDYPQLSHHVYYEGYFHAARSNDPIASINPRTGVEFPKPAATPRLRAFFLAFKEKNRLRFENLIAEICEAIPEAKSLLTFESLVADLAIQMHYGDAVTGPDLGWHFDSINSTFHLAVTLHGQRALHLKGVRLDKQELEAGDVYASNPTNFCHAVEFQHSPTFETRSVAVQGRILIDRAIYGSFRRLPAEEMHRQVGAFLEQHVLELPSLDQVKELEQEL